jgi:hypothetical protein
MTMKMIMARFAFGSLDWDGHDSTQWIHVRF